MTLVRVVLVAAMSYSSAFSATHQKNAEQLARDLIMHAFEDTKHPANAPAADQLTTLATIANSEHVASAFKQVSYAHDESCDVTLGGLTAQLTWGFAGSGDSLSPLPAMDVRIKASAQNGPATAEGLALLLAQKGILAKAEQQALVAQLLATCNKNPLCLVALKLALLFKDHSDDKAFIRSESACLLMRLSLTKLPDAVSKIDSITALLPQPLYTKIKTYAPDLLEFIDICWMAITHNNENPIADFYTVDVVITKNSDSATLINKALAGYAGPSLVTEAKDALVSKGIKYLDPVTFDSIITPQGPFKHIFTTATYPSTALNTLPACVRTALDSAAMHTVVMITTPENHWFVYKTATLSATDTAKAFSVTLLNGIRRLVQDRTSYLSAHPLAVAQHKKAVKDARIQQIQVAHYLATEEGKRFSRKIEAKIEQAQKNTQAHHARSGQGFSAIATLEKLRQQADAFRAAGKTVPADLVAAIKDITPTAAAADSPALLDAAGIATMLAQTYATATRILTRELQQSTSQYDASCASITDKYQRLLAHNTFELQQMPAKSYAAWLSQEAVRFTATAELLRKLSDYRLLHKCGILDSTQEDKLANMAELEVRVGHLLAYDSSASLIDALRRKPSSLEMVTYEIFTTPAAYSALQADLLNQLMVIMKRSPHVQENIDIYRYIIDLFMPTLLPMFDRLIAAQQAVL